MWVWVNTYRYIFSGMNIHLPAILMFTRGTRFWPIPMLCLAISLECEFNWLRWVHFSQCLQKAVPLERWHRKSACSGQVVRRFDDTWRISKWVNVTDRKSCRIITIEYSRLIILAVHFVILVLHCIAALLLLLLWFSRTCHVLQAISVDAGPHPRPDRCQGCQVPDKMAE